jgi:Cu2+-exporting ATPase
MKLVMLTGDTEANAMTVAKETGIEDVKYSVRADQKGEVVQELMESGKVAMVGDGINDAHALAVSDVGIALSTGTDIAMSSAQVTLLGKGIEHLPRLFELARRTMQTVNQNLFWAFIYNLIAIPIAAGALYPITGTLLSPMIAGAAMALSSLSVMFNSLRLKIQLN